MAESKSVIRWAEVSPGFGGALPDGSCNAVIEEDEWGPIVCGYPRRSDGTCIDGHPAAPVPHPAATDPSKGGA